MLLDALSAEHPSPATLTYAHQQLLYTWVLAPETVPQGWVALDGLVALEERRVALGQDETDALRLSREAAFELAQRGRHQDGRDFVRSVLPLFEGPSANLAYLHLRLAGLHRALEEREAGLDAVARADEEIGRLEADDPELQELRISALAHRVYLLMDRGLVDLAAEPALRCYALAQAALATGDARAPSLFHEGLLVRLAQLAAADRHEALLAFLERPEVRAARKADDSPLRSAMISLREAIAWTNLEHEEPQRPKRALRNLRALRDQILADEIPIPADEKTLLHSWLAVAAIEAGAITEARTHLATCLEGGNETLRLRAHVTALQARASLVEGAASGLLDAEELHDHRDALKAVFDELLARWAARPPRTTGEGLILTNAFNEVVAESVGVLLALNEKGRGAQDALEVLLQLQAVQSLAKSLDAGPVSVADVQSWLGGTERHGALVLLTGWRRSVALTIDATSVQAHVLPPYAELAVLRRGLLDALETQLFAARPEEALVARSTRQFARAFLGDGLRERLETWDALTIVEQQSLGYLPYELLPWSDGRTLGERFAVDYLPSFPVGATLAKRNASSGEAQTAVDLVVPFPATLDEQASRSEAQALAFGPFERAMLLDGWPGERPRVASGDRARLAALRADAAAWILVGHGERSASSSRPQGVRLADVTLTPELGENLAAPETVILLACDTWKGPWRRGDDGRGHLVGSLFLAGARTQIVSSTRIDYHAGLQLVRWMVEAMEAGAPAAAALRHARRRARETFASPARLWNASLLHVVGLGQRHRWR